MIESIEQKNETEKQMRRLENSLIILREKLLPNREKQFKAMASGYINKLRELREEIDEFTGMSMFNVPPKDINIHLVGPAIGYSRIPISVISQYFDSFRKSLQVIYASVNKIRYKTNIPKEVANACDFNLLGFSGGSVNISLGLPIQQLSFLNDNDSINKSINFYFKILDWANNKSRIEDININGDVPNKALISIIKTLPNDKEIKEITFSGRMIGKYKKITVNKNARQTIKDILIAPDTDEEKVELEGRIRELDLDKKSFILRNIVGKDFTEIICYMSDAVAEQPKDYLDSTVMITGVKKKQNNYINVKLIEIVDD